MTTPDPRTNSSVDLLRQWAAEFPDDIATYHRTESDGWVPTTWAVLWERVERTAAAFVALGLRPGDRLAIIARTSREWQIAEQAGTLAGAIVVGIDPQAAPEQVTWIAEHAGVTSVVAESQEQLTKISASARGSLKFAAVLLPPTKHPRPANVHAWDRLLEKTPAPTTPLAPCDPDATAILIYTSGTTGAPKGIEYSHRQLMAACRAMLDEFPDLQQPNRLVCWLPMAALFQRMVNLLGMASRSPIYFVEDPRDIMSAIAEVKPTVFFSVPRFYEKVHDGIRGQLSRQKGLAKRLTDAALSIGAAHAQAVRAGSRPAWWVTPVHAALDRLVLRRLRAVFGGEMKWMITGSAAAPGWLLEFYHSIGLLLLEAYGITENPVPVAANRPDAYKFGSVGRPFAVSDIRLSDQHEVLVKGPALFKGYRGEGVDGDRFTSDGYYRTGDLGRLDEDGFLFLTGRIAELIKTSTGRRISPVAVEGVYRQSRYIDQVVVIGNDRPYLTALVVLNATAIQDALTERGGPTLSSHEMTTSNAVFDVVDTELTRLGAALSRHEQIRAFRMVAEPFSVEGGTMTPTLKLRRDRIAVRYRELIDEMYINVDDTTIWRVRR